MNEKMLKKDDKWLLASHIQKSIRRGLVEEVSWAVRELHKLDRAYLAYRLSVIAVEDVASGSISEVASLVSETPWGAKRFGNKKDDVEIDQWKDAASFLASLVKDRTPCEWIGCSYWLKEFEEQEGKWESLNPIDCIYKAYDDNLEWWKRGLFAWRAVGTKRFPNKNLPDEDGLWNEWVEASSNSDLKIVMNGLGAKQREAHPIFIPLSLKSRIEDKESKIVNFKLVNEKTDIWLTSAIDSHTKSGISSIYSFIKSLSYEDRKVLKQFNSTPEYMVSKLMFWMEGGHIDKGYSYTLQKKIPLDIKKRWLKSVNGNNGQTIFDILGKPSEWSKFKEHQIKLIISNNTSTSIKNKF